MPTANFPLYLCARRVRGGSETTHPTSYNERGDYSLQDLFHGDLARKLAPPPRKGGDPEDHTLFYTIEKEIRNMFLNIYTYELIDSARAVPENFG
ncbi:hypothetical protein ACRQF6_08990 [Actinotignum sp. GS-2025f]|uniref:hypothetical protein n=1 Tax=Actinotignum sp. GS-2025f TaxID=3427279 RepID=UPI003F46FF55